MMDGTVTAIYIAEAAGAPMQPLPEVEAITGAGLMGDRYCSGAGSFNKGKAGNRQVTLMNGFFFGGSGFDYGESRRNIITSGVELMGLIGREFRIGDALLIGVKYCDPCLRPTKLAGKTQSFKEAFADRGGLIASVIEGGVIKVGDPVVPPSKGY